MALQQELEMLRNFFKAFPDLQCVQKFEVFEVFGVKFWANLLNALYNLT